MNLHDNRIPYIGETTPHLIIESQKVIQSLEDFQRLFGAQNVFYAIKANPDPSVVSLLHHHDCNFEISSIGELALLKNLDISASKVISAGTIKTPEFIETAFNFGVRYFTTDSETELRQIAALAPGSKLVVRLVVSNEGSEWPLSRKFGVETNEAVKLLEMAQQLGLVPWGISFHVGSQCTRPSTWVEAIDTAKIVWQAAQQKGIYLKSLNLGGGFPIPYVKPIPDLKDIANRIHRSLENTFPDLEDILVEPGRAIVGQAGTLVATVVASAERDGQRWVYLDVGTFNGLMESIGGIKYSILANGKDGESKCVLAGPSCDSMDVIDTDAYLPDLAVNDRVMILSAGAYTTAYASHFGGLSIPKIYLV